MTALLDLTNNITVTPAVKSAVYRGVTLVVMTPVEVLVDGRWHPGTLERWKHDDRGWVGYVWWSEGPGLTHVEWIKAEQLRPVELLRPPDAVLDRMDAVAAGAAVGRDAGDAWADEDLGGC